MGNIYNADFKVPLIIRNQHIQLHFINHKKANLKLHGFINNEGDVYYQYDKNTNTFTYTADESIKNIMNKYLVSLHDISYNTQNDTPILIIKSKILRFKQKLIFYRRT